MSRSFHVLIRIERWAREYRGNIKTIGGRRHPSTAVGATDIIGKFPLELNPHPEIRISKNFRRNRGNGSENDGLCF